MDTCSYSTWVGGGLFNFIHVYQFIKSGTNPLCPASGFPVWTGLQGTEDVRSNIATSDADMEDLDRRNA